jgi:serine-type D-Ala-D-Ala carboxypeptidase/endopeptidase
MNTCFAVATTWIPPGGGLYSSANDLLKFISANIGLIKTKLDSAMQASHLIKHSTGFLIPNNIDVSGENTNIIKFEL